MHTQQTQPSGHRRINAPTLAAPLSVVRRSHQAASHTRLFQKSSDDGNQDFDFKEFDIDDILSEAEDALKVAENSLETQNGSDGAAAATTAKSASTQPTSSATSSSAQSRPTIALDAENLKNTIASTMGGVLFGTILGSIATFQFQDLSLALDNDSSIFILPVLGAISLGIIGAIGGSQNNALGTLVRSILAAPILLLASSLQSAAARQVERTTNEIKALPQNVVNSAQQRVQSTVESAVDEVTSLPRKARDKVVDNVKTSVNSAVEEVTSIPRKAVENVKSLPQKAKDSVIDSPKESLLGLVVLPLVIALAFLLVDAFATGRL